MSQRSAKLERKLEHGENALAEVGKARLLRTILTMKAEYINNPLGESLLHDLDEQEKALKQAQDHIYKLIGWIY